VHSSHIEKFGEFGTLPLPGTQSQQAKTKQVAGLEVFKAIQFVDEEKRFLLPKRLNQYAYPVVLKSHAPEPMPL
jgi:hypothetical protein